MQLRPEMLMQPHPSKKPSDQISLIVKRTLLTQLVGGLKI